MCGIIGYAGQAPPSGISLEHLRHRGPDAHGSWSNGKDCILGHARLAIIDLDHRADQPMSLSPGALPGSLPGSGLTLLLNGEIYNYEELRREYLADAEFFSSSDTEVLLRLWERRGPECLSLLRGMFALAVWDERDHSLFLARDRLGKKPLFIWQGDRSIAFASEVKPLLQLLPAPPRLDLEAVDLFLGCQFIPGSHSIYQDVSKLPPGHVAVWRDGSMRLTRYWELRFQPEVRPEEEVLCQVEDTLREAVRIRLRADVPVGTLLSGGVDSSLVTAMAAELSGKRIQTFSVGFRETGFNELPHARLVAEKYDTEHHEIILEEGDAQNQLLEAVDAYGEPFADKSALPSLLICSKAAQHIKVVLNGDGGDEAFAGYGKYKTSGRIPLGGAAAANSHSLCLGLEALGNSLPCPSLRRALGKAGRSVSPLTRVLRLDDFITRAEQGSLYNSAFHRHTARARAKYEQALLAELPLPSHPVNALFSVDFRHYLAGDLLVKMDIASMRHSLEARSPLLDQELFELSATIPPQMKTPDGVRKYLLKKLALKYVPEEAILRPKQGFSIPVGQWLRTAFLPPFQEMLAQRDNPLWDLLRREAVEGYLKHHLAGGKGYGYKLWVVLVLGLWLQRNRGNYSL